MPFKRLSPHRCWWLLCVRLITRPRAQIMHCNTLDECALQRLRLNVWHRFTSFIPISVTHQTMDVGDSAKSTHRASQCCFSSCFRLEQTHDIGSYKIEVGSWTHANALLQQNINCHSNRQTSLISAESVDCAVIA